MKNPIELFTRLGDVMRRAADDPSWQSAVGRACRQNPWFTPREVWRAIDAIARDMLSEDILSGWLSAYDLPAGSPRQVLVVMAGNIPLVGFFDLMCVVASGHRCLVKPSGKDRALIEQVVGQLLQIDPETPVGFYDGTQRVDALIATGSDNAARYFKTHYGAIPSLLRGSRQSVAVLDGTESQAELDGLADDIWAYSGLGCRNVSMVFLPEGCDLHLTMPDMNPKYRNNYLQNRALKRMEGIPFTDLGCALLVEGDRFPTSLSEVAVRRYRSADEVAEWLERHDSELQCIVSKCISHPRCVGFGRAQSPRPTDYPDAVDVIGWLLALK